MPLEEYKDVVGTAAGVVTAAQFFSPVFICKKIISQGSTENVDPMPFVGGFGMSILMLQHGLLLEDKPMIVVNILAFFLNLIYSSIFLLYTDEKNNVLKNVVKTVSFSLLIVAYAQIDSRLSPDRVEIVYGTIITILLFALIGAPLKELKTIIATQNAEILPFPMILCGTFVTFLWLLYGIIIQNIFMQFQNVVGFALSAFQLGLCLKYSQSPKEKGKKKE